MRDRHPAYRYAHAWLLMLLMLRPQDASMFDPVQAPALRHAFELVNAAVLEADLRLRHQIPDRARDQHFAGARFRGDPRADVESQTDHVGATDFVFARMQPDPDLQPQRAHRLADRGRAIAIRGRRATSAIGQREQSAAPVVATTSFPRQCLLLDYGGGVISAFDAPASTARNLEWSRLYAAIGAGEVSTNTDRGDREDSSSVAPDGRAGAGSRYFRPAVHSDGCAAARSRLSCSPWRADTVDRKSDTDLARQMESPLRMPSHP